MPPPTTPRPAAKNRDRDLFRTAGREQLLLGGAAFPPQRLPLNEGQLRGLTELLLNQHSEREIQVVTAEKQMFADRDPLEDELSQPLVNAGADQAEVRRASSDVADKYERFGAERGR